VVYRGDAIVDIVDATDTSVSVCTQYLVEIFQFIATSDVEISQKSYFMLNFLPVEQSLRVTSLVKTRQTVTELLRIEDFSMAVLA